MAKEHTKVLDPSRIKEVKPWRLPYWTDKPVWESERPDSNIRQRSRIKIIHPEAKSELNEKQLSEKDLSEKELDESNQQELNELPQLPTAEELENIRREAYNAGLEQGLIEGRQQGHQEGFAAGQQEGQTQGLEAGTNEGYQAGFSQGESVALAQAQERTDAVVQQLQQLISNLHSHINERDQQIPQVLTQLVVDLCQQVVGQELQQGSANIQQFVQQALAKLPEGEEHVRIFVSSSDAEHLAQSLQASGSELNYQVDATLNAGECRVESEHSLTYYSVSAHMQQLLEEVQQQMLASVAEPIAEPEQIIEPEPTTEPDDIETSGIESNHAETAPVEPTVATDEASDHEAE